MNDMQPTDQTLNMSPMDLFDSIFWGESYNLVLSGELTKKIHTHPMGWA